jgi:hypothetical protein
MKLRLLKPNDDIALGLCYRFEDESLEQENGKTSDITAILKGLSLMSGYVTEEEFYEYYWFLTNIEAKTLLEKIKEENANIDENGWQGYSQEYHQMMNDSGRFCISERLFLPLIMDKVDPFDCLNIDPTSLVEHLNLLGMKREDGRYDLLSNTFYPYGGLFVITPDVIKVIESIALAEVKSVFDSDYSNDKKLLTIKAIIGDLSRLKRLTTNNLIIGSAISFLYR